MAELSKSESESGAAGVWRRHSNLLICVLLVAATLAVYAQVGGFDFVKYDDTTYVVDNEIVQAGLTREGFVWAFTTGHASNWHPLTWLSHMLDCQLFGVDPGKAHVVNLVLHMASTVLLFMALKKITGASGRSAFVAALFALHPLHVESVAWIAERKDVLSTFFLFLTVWAYVRYAKGPRVVAYLLTLVFFALGLLSKPMLVTLPFVLLLLDYWPLERFGAKLLDDEGADQPGKSTKAGFQRCGIFLAVCEKIPFLALAAISSLVTFRVQQSGGAVQQMEGIFGFSIKTRIINALVSYLWYIWKMFWPSGLGVHYPHPADKLQLWHGIVAAVLLLTVTVWALWLARRRKYFIVGWLWYIGMLVPVIGLVQVGAQAMADRYTYVPMVGLFVVIAWGACEMLARLRYQKIILGAAMVAILSTLGVCTWQQVGYWRDAVTLFQRAIEVTENNEKMYLAMSQIMFEQGKAEEAIKYLGQTLGGQSADKEASDGLQMILGQGGEIDKAFANELMSVSPVSMKAQKLVSEGKIGEAIEVYLRALEEKPDDVGARYELAVLLQKHDRIAEAVEQYRKLLEVAPNHPVARIRLNAALKKLGQ